MREQFQTIMQSIVNNFETQARHFIFDSSCCTTFAKVAQRNEIAQQLEVGVSKFQL